MAKSIVCVMLLGKHVLKQVFKRICLGVSGSGGCMVLCAVNA